MTKRTTVLAQEEPSPPRVPLGHEATIAFLEQHKIPLLKNTKWKAGQPLLFVLHSQLIPRSKFGTLDVEMKPSLVRVDNPTALNQFFLHSFGQCDYYALDAETKEIIRVKVSDHSKRNAEVEYQIATNFLFAAADHLFPKGKPPVQK